MARLFRRTCRPTVCAWPSGYYAPAKAAFALGDGRSAERSVRGRSKQTSRGGSQVDQLLVLACWSSLDSRLTSTAVTRVYQLASDTRVPPQLPNPPRLGGVAFQPGQYCS